MATKKNIVDHTTVEILEHIADVMHLESYQNEVKDFKPGDIVKSSILHGLFKVTLIGNITVLVQRLDGGEEYPIRAKYLKKVEINQNTVDILYNGN